MSRIYYRGARAAIVCYGKGTVLRDERSWWLRRSRAGDLGTGRGWAAPDALSQISPTAAVSSAPSSG